MTNYIVALVTFCMAVAVVSFVLNLFGQHPTPIQFFFAMWAVYKVDSIKESLDRRDAESKK